MKKIFRAFFAKIVALYIELVHRTTKATVTGCYDLVTNNENNEKFVISPWHGESHCCYPILKNTEAYIVTTTNKRGEYISNIGKHFGYESIRLPDESKGENYMFKMRSMINGGDKKHNVIITLDGPSGPYHEPKKFVLLTALLTKRRIIPVRFDFKRKILLKKRWDNYLIPLPFNKCVAHFYDPIEINKNNIEEIGKEITIMMETTTNNETVKNH